MSDVTMIEEISEDRPIQMSDLAEVANGADKKPRKDRVAIKAAATSTTVPRVTTAPPPEEDTGSGSVVSKSPPLTAMRTAEDYTIKEMLENLGGAGGFKVRVTRKAPNDFRDPATGKLVATGGYLDTVDEVIDENWLAQKYGGGKYELVVSRRDSKGKFAHVTGRTVVIAGDPNITELPRNVVQPNPQGAAGGLGGGESPALALKAMDIMAKSVQDAQDRADRSEHRPTDTRNPAMDQMVQMMNAQLAAANQQVAEMRREMAEARNAPAVPVDTYKERLLDKMLDGDSARLQSVRMQYESEIRTAKDNSIAEERRLREVFERDKADLRASHEREMALMRSSHDNALLATRQSHEISIAAARSSFETQTKLSDAENRRLERDNITLLAEVKELRAKKDKSIIDQVKEMEVIKEALGVGGDEDKSTVDKFVGALTNPELLAAGAAYFQKKKEPDPVPQAMVHHRPMVMAGPNGQRFVMGPDGTMLPARRKQRPQPRPQAVPQPQATSAEGLEVAQEVTEPAHVEAPVPAVDPDQVGMLVNFFENSFASGQDPETVARTIRAQIPGELLIYLRDRVTEHGLAQGVDLFLSKVAKLPSTSSLAAQSGRNWIRKVGGALVGD